VPIELPSPVTSELGNWEQRGLRPIYLRKLLLLLALASSLRRMLVRCLRISLRVASVLLRGCVIAFGMMLGSGPMRLGSLIMLFSCLFVHFLWHEIAPIGFEFE
jgi:hypothetical protein